VANVAKRLAGPAVGTGSEATLYTVPGSTVTTVQSIRVVNTTSGALTFKMSIGADAAGTRLFSDYPVPANGILKDAGFDVVMVAAETLRWTAAAGLTVTVNGVETT
jgi:hypothetical protein